MILARNYLVYLLIKCFLVPDLEILLQTQVFPDFTRYLPALNGTVLRLLQCDSLGDDTVIQSPCMMTKMDPRPKMT